MASFYTKGQGEARAVFLDFMTGSVVGGKVLVSNDPYWEKKFWFLCLAQWRMGDEKQADRRRSERNLASETFTSGIIP